MQKLTRLITLVILSLSLPMHAAYVLESLGSGSTALTGTPTRHAAISFTPFTVNRSATGFGNITETQPSIIEGAWFQYTFTVPSTGGTNPNFDMQNTMGGMWSGMGGPTNGEWQRGPTTSTWSRGIRIQHDYRDRVGTNATVRPATAVEITPTLNTTLAMPKANEVISVLMVFNAITNDFEYTYRNLTTNEVFQHTILGSVSAAPTSNITFNTLNLRSDSGIEFLDYSFGSLHVVPEPTKPLLLLAGIFLLSCIRRRKIRA